MYCPCIISILIARLVSHPYPVILVQPTSCTTVAIPHSPSHVPWIPVAKRGSRRHGLSAFGLLASLPVLGLSCRVPTSSHPALPTTPFYCLPPPSLYLSPLLDFILSCSFLLTCRYIRIHSHRSSGSCPASSLAPTHALPPFPITTHVSPRLQAGGLWWSAIAPRLVRTPVVLPSCCLHVWHGGLSRHENASVELMMWASSPAHHSSFCRCDRCGGKIRTVAKGVRSTNGQ
ncbi:hypothetical protein C2E23DRAFT_469906 [Lenzites betulinus]|nr:hypothetical protein C2E23DRAFT_469906 [Lenzites betulinus]